MKNTRKRGGTDEKDKSEEIIDDQFEILRISNQPKTLVGGQLRSY